MRLAKYPCVLHMNTVILYMFNLQLCVLKVGIRKQLRKSKKRKKKFNRCAHCNNDNHTEKKNMQKTNPRMTPQGGAKQYFTCMLEYTPVLYQSFFISHREVLLLEIMKLFIFKAHSNYQIISTDVYREKVYLELREPN